MIFLPQGHLKCLIFLPDRNEIEGKKWKNKVVKVYANLDQNPNTITVLIPLLKPYKSLMTLRMQFKLLPIIAVRSPAPHIKRRYCTFCLTHCDTLQQLVVSMPRHPSNAA